MFSNEKAGKTVKSEATEKVDTLIGEGSRVEGSLVFSGGLHVDGQIKGSVQSENASSILILSDKGSVEGEIHVPHIQINGRVKGDLYSTEKLVLAEHARIDGNVHYRLIEIAVGAEINGQLIHQEEGQAVKPKAKTKEQVTENE